MAAGNHLVEIIRQASKRPQSEETDLLFGVVTSVNPLKIKIDNRFEVDETFLILSVLCKEIVIKIPYRESFLHLHEVPEHISQPGGTDNHTHVINAFNTGQALPEILLWRGLEVGDEVRLLRISKGQTFFVLERVEGII
jgi:hypothetical protein